MANLNKKMKKGFTLIELVVVIVIIAVLVAIIAPTALGDNGGQAQAEQRARSMYYQAQTAVTPLLQEGAITVGSSGAAIALSFSGNALSNLATAGITFKDSTGSLGTGVNLEVPATTIIVSGSSIAVPAVPAVVDSTWTGVADEAAAFTTGGEAAQALFQRLSTNRHQAVNDKFGDEGINGTYFVQLDDGGRVEQVYWWRSFRSGDAVGGLYPYR